MNFALAELIRLIDLTSLNDTDSEERIIALCHQALTPCGPVAAVCIYPHFLSSARKELNASIRLAAVLNFPHGTDPLLKVIADAKVALADGADELDVVIPYQACLQDDKHSMQILIQTLRAILPHSCTLKVILETGILQDGALIFELGLLALEAGADFLKTSTGKTPIGATVPAVAALINAVKTYQVNTGTTKGIKISGGLRQLSDIEPYLALIKRELGETYLNANTFRIGASSLLNHLCAFTDY